MLRYTLTTSRLFGDIPGYRVEEKLNNNKKNRSEVEKHNFNRNICIETSRISKPLPVLVSGQLSAITDFINGSQTSSYSNHQAQLCRVIIILCPKVSGYF